MSARYAVVIAKPEAVSLGLEHLMEQELRGLGLEILATKRCQLTLDEAIQLYLELKGEYWFPRALYAITRGPIVVFLVSGENAVSVVKAWRGPNVVNDPDQSDKTTFRYRMTAEYGTDDDKWLRPAVNYVHSSGGAEEARWEAHVLFPDFTPDT